MNRTDTSGLILGLLGIVFVVLKLLGKISWSWWWVLAPFWAPVALVLGILVIVAIIAGLVALFTK